MQSVTLLIIISYSNLVDKHNQVKALLFAYITNSPTKICILLANAKNRFQIF